MDPITIALAALGLLVVGSGVRQDEDTAKSPADSPIMKDIEKQVRERLANASLISIPDISTWVQVQNGADNWLVCPRYIAPVGIGEANRVATSLGFQLPTCALVDAIYAAADMKLQPHPRGAHDKPPSDFTSKTMNSPETNVAQLAYIQKQIDAAGGEYKLLAGTHKDVVYDKIPFGVNAGQMHLGIYGWQLAPGKNIQSFMWGHASGDTPGTDWKDYSQGLRLCKKL